MSSVARLQDMPPSGGYAPIDVRRILPRTYFRGWHWFAALLVCKSTAAYIYLRNQQRRRAHTVESHSARLAIQPLLLAEDDRLLLKQLYLNREEERKLMANVPDWEVGKYFKEPLYKTVPKDTWVLPISTDYFAHSAPDAYTDRMNFNLYH